MTAQEHFIAHSLLWRAATKRYGIKSVKTRKLGYAFRLMSFSSSNQKRYTSRTFQQIKEWYSCNNPSLYRDVSGSNNPMFGISGNKHHLFGIACSQERKDKISKANKGKLSGNKNPSKRKEVRYKISKNRKGISPFFMDTHPKSILSNEIRKEIIEQYLIYKGSLYSFTSSLAKHYNVSRGAIQGMVYPSERLQKNMSLLSIT